MRVEIWCKNGYGCPGEYPQDGRIEAVKLQELELDAIPRDGDLIEVFEGWSASSVCAVWWLVESNKVRIDIGPDYGGEYAAEVAKRAKNEVEL